MSAARNPPTSPLVTPDTKMMTSKTGFLGSKARGMDGGIVASQPCDDGTNCQGGYQPVDPQVTFWRPNA
ncbi:MAG: hypothetical protein OEW84_08445 [Aigarchaeota archaeon]|nr:hypothetical protein [Aigarchaeota archaeon]